MKEMIETTAMITEELSFQPEVKSPDDSEFPVLKIDDKGKILYANKASFPLLREWLCDTEQYLPNQFRDFYGDIFNPEADCSIIVTTTDSVIKFDVIGFKECGFIGLYCFDKIELNTAELQIPEYVN